MTITRKQFNKIMEFIWDNSYNVTNPCNTYEWIDMIPREKLVQYLESMVDEEDDNEN